MILTRRVFNGAALAAWLVTAGSFSSAFAGTPVPFSAEAFKAAQASDNPIVFPTLSNFTVSDLGFMM